MLQFIFHHSHCVGKLLLLSETMQRTTVRNGLVAGIWFYQSQVSTIERFTISKSQSEHIANRKRTER